MPKFKVAVQETVEFTVEVEADSEDAAGDNAVEIVTNSTREQLDALGIYSSLTERSVVYAEEVA